MSQNWANIPNLVLIAIVKNETYSVSNLSLVYVIVIILPSDGEGKKN